ncbi:hypothetical protein M6D81_12450 [Paenibacillus sp. J5C_2022]|nr:hypothetical protein [Paenibacillus sp. J5C2022]
MLLAIGLMVTASICLAQNYTESLIPGIQDGIGIANPFTYLIIGEDGWSVQTFRSYFHGAVIATLALVAAYPLIIVLESRKKQRSHS